MWQDQTTPSHTPAGSEAPSDDVARALEEPARVLERVQAAVAAVVLLRDPGCHQWQGVCGKRARSTLAAPAATATATATAASAASVASVASVASAASATASIASVVSVASVASVASATATAGTASVASAASGTGSGG
jgi:hypothetical protein